MKLVLLLFGVSLIASVAYGYPVGCEDEPELPSSDVLDLLVDVVEDVKLSDGHKKANVIDPPKVCPDGQILDHQGKCRPVMG